MWVPAVPTMSDDHNRLVAAGIKAVLPRYNPARYCVAAVTLIDIVLASPAPWANPDACRKSCHAASSWDVWQLLAPSHGGEPTRFDALPAP